MYTFFAKSFSGLKERNIKNYSFDTVYAFSQIDEIKTDETESADDKSVLSGSTDGDWSVWSYLEYVIAKIIGDAG